MTAENFAEWDANKAPLLASTVATLLSIMACLRLLSQSISEVL
jgi:hypothetical protein